MTTEKKTVRSNYKPECTVLFLIGFHGHQPGERCVVLQDVYEPRGPHRRLRRAAKEGDGRTAFTPRAASPGARSASQSCGAPDGLAAKQKPSLDWQRLETRKSAS